MPKIYVAGKKIPRAKEVMKMIRGAGYEITFDWAENYNEDNWAEDSLAEREGIKKCDIFVYLWCEDAKSARYEAGMAMGLEKPIIISGGPDSFFYRLPNVTSVEDDSKILDAISSLQK
jgi:hypothetical protein